MKKSLNKQILILLLFINSILSISLRSTKSLTDLGKFSDEQLESNDEVSDEDVDLVAAVNKYREELGLSTLKYNDALSAQAKEVVEHIIQIPQEFDKNFNFVERTQEIPNRYYTEDQCKLLYKPSAAEKCIQLMIVDPDSQADLERDHDEAGSYCGLYGNGYICSIQMIKLAETSEDLSSLL